MMKFTYPVNLAIAGVLVVPTAALQSGAADSLEESLQRTLVALEHLAGIEERVETGATGVVEEVLKWTEPALQTAGDPAANDRLLEELRSDVGQLQAQVDLARQRIEPGAAATPPATILPSGAFAGTTGLDETTRRRLSGAAFARRSPQVETAAAAPTAAVSPTPEAAVEPSTKQPFEAEGYSADVLLLGRALYRQGRYAEAAKALKPRKSELEGQYWIARCLEKLGQSGEAIEAYDAVIEMAKAEDPEAGGQSHFAQRAREDLEFLRWRIEFEKADGSKRPL
jgi:tetratricopeptide (TPR) repeat protein